MDELSETDHLFSTRTVDEVATYCRETQKEIVKTQEELRTLIGKKYRELLDCCDLVVGMDGVCDQIQRHWIQINSSKRNSKSRRLPLNGQRPSSDVFSSAYEVHRTAYAALLSLRQRCFRRAIEDYNNACAHIGDDAEQAVAPPMLYAAARITDSVRATLSDSIVDAIQSMASLPPIKNTSEFYDDIHSALQQMEGLTNFVVAEKIIAMHLNVMDRVIAQHATDPKTLGSCLATLIMRGLCYIKQRSCATTTAEAKHTMLLSVDQLLAVDHHSEGFEDLLQQQVCQLGALNEASHQLPASDWSSPLTSQQLPLELGTLTVFFMHETLDRRLKSVCSTLDSMALMTDLENSFLSVGGSAAWSDLIGSDELVSLLSKSKSILLSSLVDLCVKRLSGIEQEVLDKVKKIMNSDPTSGNCAQSSISTHDKPSKQLLQQILHQTGLRLCGSASSEVSSSTSRKDDSAAFGYHCNEIAGDFESLLSRLVCDVDNQPEISTLKNMLKEQLLRVLLSVANVCRRALATIRTAEYQ